MSFHFHRIVYKAPNPPRTTKDLKDSWRVYGLCNCNRHPCCITRKDLADLPVSSQKGARSAILSLLQRAHSGRQFHNLYLGDAFHEGIAWKENNTSHTIHRIRNGDSRIYITFLDNKIVVIIGIKMKTTTLITSEDKNLLIGRYNIMLESLKNKNFSTLVIPWPIENSPIPGEVYA